jgi:hypothetical protein
MGFIGADGKFYTGQPKMASMVPQATSVWKAADHDRQRADHKADLVRPYLPSGEPNPEFIALYPEESINTYHFIKSDEQLSKEQ